MPSPRFLLFPAPRLPGSDSAPFLEPARFVVRPARRKRPRLDRPFHVRITREILRLGKFPPRRKHLRRHQHRLSQSPQPISAVLRHQIAAHRPRIRLAIVVTHQRGPRPPQIPNRTSRMHQVRMPDKHISLLRQKHLLLDSTLAQLLLDVVQPRRHLAPNRMMRSIAKPIQRHAMTARKIRQRPRLRMHILERRPRRRQHPRRPRRHEQRIDVHVIRAPFPKVQTVAQHRCLAHQLRQQTRQRRIQRDLPHQVAHQIQIVELEPQRIAIRRVRPPRPLPRHPAVHHHFERPLAQQSLHFRTQRIHPLRRKVSFQHDEPVAPKPLPILRSLPLVESRHALQKQHPLSRLKPQLAPKPRPRTTRFFTRRRTPF